MKKQKKEESEDLPYSFWKKYDEADMLEREELLKPIIKNFLSLSKVKDEKLLQHTLLILLRGYFDDLIEYSYTKKSKK